MDYQNSIQKRQENLPTYYKLTNFDTFLCEETPETVGYGKQIKRASWLIDLKNAKHYWSEELYEMAGIAPGSTPNMMFWVDLLHKEELLKFTSYLEKTERECNTNEFTFTIQGNHPPKTIKCCMEALKGYYNSQPEFIIGTFFDITDGDSVENTNTIQQLQKENERNRQLLSIIAHDLKNPFNTILGLAEFLLQPNRVHCAEKTELYLRTILTGARNAHIMLVRLLEWSKSQNENWQVLSVNLDLYGLINDVFNELEIVSASKNIELVNRCEKETIVFTDSEMIRIVLRNLVSNAIKFSFKDSLIVISVKKTQDYLQLSVTDFGIGMESDKAKKIFQSEINEPGLGTANERGTGVGLSICKTLVEKIGGHIWVKSELGSGSSFTFTIPLVIS